MPETTAYLPFTVGSSLELVFFIARFILQRAHGVPCNEIRHVPAQRVAEDAGGAEMDAAEDASVSDF